jgi:hypothetical protein
VRKYMVLFSNTVMVSLVACDIASPRWQRARGPIFFFL